MDRKYVIAIVLTFAVLVSALPSKKKQDDESGKTVKKEDKKTKEQQTEQKKAKDNVEDEEDEEEEEESDGGEEEDEDEESKHMTFCLAQENVTEAEMKDFLMSKPLAKVREPLKKAVLCFLKKMEFFDGKNWDVDNIAETIGENTKTFKNIKACLKKDDKKLQPHERTYRVQKCVLDSESTQKSN